MPELKLTGVLAFHQIPNGGGERAYSLAPEPGNPLAALFLEARDASGARVALVKVTTDDGGTVNFDCQATTAHPLHVIVRNTAGEKVYDATA